MHEIWTSVIAGSYVALCVTMWITAGVYAARVLRTRASLDAASLALMAGIAISFTGHGFDQLLWAASNVWRALSGSDSLTLSTWYAKEIPWVVVAGKFLASAGAFPHLWLAFHDQHRPGVAIGSYALAWCGVVALVVFLTY